MANAEHLKILKEGVEVWNKWRKENPEIRPDLSGADLYRIELSGINLKLAFMEKTILSRAILDKAILEEAILKGAILEGALLKWANLKWANLKEANLNEAILDGANLEGANLEGALLRRALLTGAYLKEANLESINLSEAFLDHADLRGVNLSKADLSEAKLFRADLSSADLHLANLSSAYLCGANLQKAILFKAILRYANLRDANLQEADLREANLQNADFRGAIMQNTNLHNAKSNVFEMRWPEDDIPRILEKPAQTIDPPSVGSPLLQFDGIFPSPFRPNIWQDLLVYVYFRQALDKVLDDFERRKGLLTGTFSGSSAESQTQIPRDSILTIIPDIPSVECNPSSIKFKMTEDYHCLQFRVRHQTSSLVERLGSGRIQGTISVYLETLLIGEIPVQSTWEAPGAAPSPGKRSMLISSIAASPEPEKPKEDFKRQEAQAFRKIFVSYSHQDAPIIEGLEKAYKVIGDDYWCDIQSLRSGQKWSNEIETAINGSDVFQLCWSNQSKSSEFVEREWRAALQRRTENFIRPLYWEKPMPDPPEELGHLHFAYYPLGG